MFKRLLGLAVALAIFVTTFFIYFHVKDAEIENGFRQEREKYHVENLALTAPDTAGIPGDSTAPPSSGAPAVSGAPPVPQTSAPGVDSNAAPVSPNALIGPVPPPAAPGDSAAPDSSSAPDNPATPATPASSDAPSGNTPASAPSTMVYPGLNRLPLALVASYGMQGIQVQTPAPASSGTGAMVSPAPALETPTNAATDTHSAPAAVPPETPAMTPSSSKSEASARSESDTNRPSTAGNAAPQTVSTAPGKPLVSVPSSVIVLGYHQFTGPGVPSKNIYSMRQDVFDEEMKYLKDNNYHVVPLADVVKFVKGEIGLPPNSVAVTIDDGYKSSIVWAAPVLKKYGYPWTFFVYPDFITVAEGKGAASWNDLLQLQADGVDIECHSKSHPIMTKKGGKTPEQYDAWLTAETAGAKATLEQHLGKPVDFFAYPYGAYNQTVKDKVMQAGFKAVFTVANNPVHPKITDVYSIGRYIITTPVEKAFASYLRQGALAVADTSPAAGATISDPRPVITAVLGYAGTLDPATISTDVRDYGEVRHDYDPKTSTIRLYLPRDLIDSVVVVNIRAKDQGQTMIASWRFNYSPVAPGAAHAPIPKTIHPAPATSATVSEAAVPAAGASSAPPSAPKTATDSTDTNSSASTVPASK